MESVGEKLRQCRLRQGLTLDDVSASTRISVKNLEALEKDELSCISSAFFYRSFVRQFAQRLGLDYTDLAAAVQSWASTIPEPAMPGQLQAALPKIPPLAPTRSRNFRWIFSFVALGAVLTGCSSLYAMWENSRYTMQASVSSFVKSLATTSTKSAPRHVVRTRIHPASKPVAQPAPQRLEASSPADVPQKSRPAIELPSEPFAATVPAAQTEAGLRP